ncbi:MAG: hypothetical protein RJQ09_11585, partial [Cyclobacteriaceae bacterium]
MYRLFFLLIILLSFGRSYSQTDQELATRIALEARTIDEIEGATGKYKFNKKRQRLLNLGIIQTDYQLARRKKFERIGLRTLSINSIIIYSEVYSWDFNDKWFDDEENEPPWSYQILGTNSNDQFHELNLNVEHLIRLPTTSSIFGYACYANGGLPEEGLSMMKLVNKMDTIELSKWIFSVNPVRQGFAYLGFSLLKSKGVQIDSSVSNKMSQLKSSDFEILMCSGCTIRESVPFSELLSDEKAQRFINKHS